MGPIKYSSFFFFPFTPCSISATYSVVATARTGRLPLPLRARIMSGRRSRAPGFTDDEINHLIHKLQKLLPDSSGSTSRRVKASKILEEMCNYIKRLHRDVDGLTQLLSSLDIDITTVDAETTTSLLQQ